MQVEVKLILLAISKHVSGRIQLLFRPESNTVIYNFLSISPQPTYDCVNSYQLINCAFLWQFPPLSIIIFYK